MNSSTRLFISAILAAVVWAATPCAKGAGSWKLHPAFDCHPVRIIDGERFTYFLTLAELYDKNIQNHDEAVTSVFYYDKSADEGKIKPLSDIRALSGSVVTRAEYNPDKKYLALVYDNFNIDIIPDGAPLLNIQSFRDLDVSGSKKVNSITFDSPRDAIWLAMESGYVRISDNSGKILEKGDFGHPVLHAGRVGDLTVIIDSATARVKEAGKRVSSIDDCIKPVFSAETVSPALNSDNTLKNPEGFMPLGDDCFVFASRNPSGNDFSLHAAIRHDNEWICKVLLAGGIRPIEGNKVITDRFENNFIPNRDGYLVVAADRIYQLKKESTTGGEYSDIVLEELDSGGEAGKISGSWDFSDFWFYEKREGFYRRSYDNGKAGEATDKINPECPAPLICQDMAYHPDYGMLVSGHGASPHFYNFSTHVPLLVSGYSEGKWTHYSPAYNPPGFVTSDPALRARFKSTDSDIYPLFKARGLCIDPDNPRFVYFASTLNGITRLDLSDLSQPPLRMSRPNDEYASWPGFVSAAPRQSWNVHCAFSNVDSDADGNLWTLYFNLDSNESQNELWCWSRDDREASADANITPASFRPWKKISVTAERLNGNYNRILALKTDVNRNRVVVFPNESESSVIVYDHKGTVSDTSDDSWVKFKNVKNQTGADNSFYRIYCAMEERTTGEVWIGHEKGVFHFSPSSISDKQPVVTSPKVISLKYPVGGDCLLEGMAVTAMCEDEYGRKWFGTHGAGLWGLNAENTEVIARFLETDSPLPSNTIHGLAWNPESRSLFISTKKGLAEMWPEEVGVNSSANGIYVFPDPVYPDYFGDVTISGLVTTEPVIIVNEKGETVAELGAPVEGKAVWSLSESETGYSTGRYKAAAGISGTILTEIILLR